jgi:hypothetical protein
MYVLFRGLLRRRDSAFAPPRPHATWPGTTWTSRLAAWPRSGAWGLGSPTGSPFFARGGRESIFSNVWRVVSRWGRRWFLLMTYSQLQPSVGSCSYDAGFTSIYLESHSATFVPIEKKYNHRVGIEYVQQLFPSSFMCVYIDWYTLGNTRRRDPISGIQAIFNDYYMYQWNRSWFLCKKLKKTHMWATTGQLRALENVVSFLLKFDQR